MGVTAATLLAQPTSEQVSELAPCSGCANLALLSILFWNIRVRWAGRGCGEGCVVVWGGEERKGQGGGCVNVLVGWIL